MGSIRKLMALVAFGMGALVAGASLAADAPKPAKPGAKDLVLRGDARCTECHDEADSPELLAIGKTRHGVRADSSTPECTSCHGDSNQHVDYKGSDKPPKPDVTFGKKSKTTADAKNTACLTCHQGGNRIGWQSSQHANRDIACVNCHKIHDSHDKVRQKTAQTEICYSCHKEQRSQMSRQSHHPVPEGKMACSSCHNVHGDNPKQLLRASTNETCFTCHMEKRGPFVHNHQPVTEDCGICHQPHGTNVANLLKTRPPFLCQQCHNMTGHPGQSFGLPIVPFASSTSTGNGTVARGCVNCHTNIHGGNSSQNSATAGRFRR